MRAAARGAASRQRNSPLRATTALPSRLEWWLHHPHAAPEHEDWRETMRLSRWVGLCLSLGILLLTPGPALADETLEEDATAWDWPEPPAPPEVSCPPGPEKMPQAPPLGHRAVLRGATSARSLFGIGAGSLLVFGSTYGSANPGAAAHLLYSILPQVDLGVEVGLLLRSNQKKRWSLTSMVRFHLLPLGSTRLFLSTGLGTEFGDRYSPESDRVQATIFAGGGLEIPLGALSLVAELRARFLGGETSLLASLAATVRF